MRKPSNLQLPEQIPLNKRANKEMARWRKSLSRNDRAKLSQLKTEASPWARDCNLIAPGLRRTRTYRKRQELTLEREARFRAEQAAYEARRA